MSAVVSAVVTAVVSAVLGRVVRTYACRDGGGRRWRLGGRRGGAFEDGVEGPEALLGDEPVAVDPRGQGLQAGCLEVDGPTLGVAGATHEPRRLEHLDVLADGLLADLERFGELVDGGGPPTEAGHDGASHRVGQGRERAVEVVVGHWVRHGQPTP